MRIEEIRTAEPFETLFPVDNATLNAIADSMKQSGYDPACPLVLWNGTLIDGHTRLMAAKQVGIEDVPVITKKFASEDAAYIYAVGAQTKRRQLTPAEMLKIVAEVDKRKTAEFHGNQYTDEKSGQAPKGATPLSPGTHHKSSHDTAAILNVSPRTVERYRAVIDHAPEEIKEAVKLGEKNGGMTISRAYDETQKLRRQEAEEKEDAKDTEEGENELKPRRLLPFKPGAMSRGLGLARAAIMSMEQIQKDDTEREQAFKLLKGWIAENE
jgi:ParB family chromosome partitioning protein